MIEIKVEIVKDIPEKQIKMYEDRVLLEFLCGVCHNKYKEKEMIRIWKTGDHFDRKGCLYD